MEMERTRYNSKPVTINGVEYSSISAACKAYNIDYTLVRYRNSHGYSIEDAISKPVKTDNADSVTVFGDEFKSVRQCALHYNLEPMNLYYHLTGTGSKQHKDMSKSEIIEWYLKDKGLERKPLA